MAQPDTCEAPQRGVLPPKLSLPPNICDCHFHIFDDPSIQVAERSYTAPHAPLSDYKKLQNTLGITRSVIVQPSVYGADNRTTMAVCKTDDNMRAVIVVDENISDKELKKYADEGAVGCRVNLLFSSGVVSNSLIHFAHRISDYGMHLQVLADISQFDDFDALVTQCPLPVVFDHMGHMPASYGYNHKTYQKFLSYLSDGRLWVKLSGAYRISKAMNCQYDDVADFVEALVHANSDHLVWGTDWPHPQINGPMPNDTDLLNQFFDWVPNTANQQKIFADNPAKLYQF